jgi:hypothetical protein
MFSGAERSIKSAQSLLNFSKKTTVIINIVVQFGAQRLLRRKSIHQQPVCLEKPILSKMSTLNTLKFLEKQLHL